MLIPPAAKRVDRWRLSGMPQSSASLDRFDRPPRDRGDAVIALLAIDRDMAVAACLEGRMRKQLVRALGFLQAQYVRRIDVEQMLDDRQTQPHGVDVPRGDGQRHRKFPGRTRRYRKLPAMAAAYKAARRAINVEGKTSAVVPPWLNSRRRCVLILNSAWSNFTPCLTLKIITVVSLPCASVMVHWRRS